MHRNTAAAVPSLPRGVYRASYNWRGIPLLVAVDREGNARKHIKLTGDVDELRAIAWLRGWLDRIDPVPQLQLVKPEPVDPNRSRTHNDTYEPVEAYWARLRRAGASRLPPRYR